MVNITHFSENVEIIKDDAFVKSREKSNRNRLSGVKSIS